MKNPKCCMCECECENEWGNNAQPIMEGRCCDVCNRTKVVPLRFISIKQKSAKCKYCGKPNGSTDADLLCQECRQTFGHSLYSEL